MQAHIKANQTSTSVYLHIPFCSHICYYCDFNKVFIEGQPVDEYVDAVVKEIKMTMADYPQVKSIQTLYIGGGTPTTLTPAQIDRLFKGIHQYLPPIIGEVTCEANPNDLLTTDKLQALKNNGVNRLSIGVQSFNDDILKRIGRTHRAADVYTAIANARKVGFENLSIDLIYRLPGQDPEDFARSLDLGIGLGLPHYSTYSLILEQKTIFYNLMRQGKLFLPNQDDEADMYQLAIEKMANAGLAQYEISNFAKPGMESQHNLTYWHNDHYFGFGAGAHGYLGAHRYSNFGPIQQYLAPLREDKLPIFNQHELGIKEQMEEELFLGLRTMKGVSNHDFEIHFGENLGTIYGPVIEQLTADGLLTSDEDRIYLTNHGKFLGNEVFQAFLMDEPRK